MPHVSIVILNWNTTDNTLNVMKCIDASDYQDFEVIIVDNGSDDAHRQHSPAV